MPINSIVVRVSCTYPRFEEVKAEMLSMSSEDGEEYEHLYNIYKTIDNAKYYVGDYILYKTEDDCTEKTRTALITKLNIDSDDNVYYELINTEGDTIKVYESDIAKRSTYEDFQRECEMNYNKKLEETIEEHNIDENNNDLQTTNSYITSSVDSTYDRTDNNVSYNRLGKLENTDDGQTTNSYITGIIDSTYDRTDNNVSYNRLDILEEKHNKVEKLVKLGMSVLLGGI